MANYRNSCLKLFSSHQTNGNPNGNDFLIRFVWIGLNEGFTSLMVSLENDTGSTNNVLFKQLVDVFILLIKEMKLC